MSVPPVDKINEVPDDVWGKYFFEPGGLRAIDILVMNEAAIEDFES